MELSGWVRRLTFQKEVFFKFPSIDVQNTFIGLSDGSTHKNIQIIYKSSDAKYAYGHSWKLSLREAFTFGSSIKVKGTVMESPGSMQSIEILASNIEILGVSPPVLPRWI